MNAYAISGAVLAVLSYIPLTVSVWRKTVVQNFATFFLWFFLDSVAAGATWKDGGNYLLPTVFALLCVLVFVGILRTRTFTWSWRETVTSIFVIASIAVWLFVNGKWAVIVSTTGVVVAGLPQLYDIWKKPQNAPLLVYGGLLLANVLATMAGRDWSVQERFYSASCAALTAVFVVVGLRKWLPQFRAQLA